MVPLPRGVTLLQAFSTVRAGHLLVGSGTRIILNHPQAKPFRKLSLALASCLLM